MDRKKSSILILALVVLVGGIFFIVSQINKKQEVAPVTTKSSSELEVKRNEMLNNRVLEKGGDENTNTFTGKVMVIDQYLLTVKNTNESIGLNITGATPVMDAGKVSQMADLKVGDDINVTYDKTTKNATLIYIVRMMPQPVPAEK
ncbi:MAG: hypothetical protein WCK16_01530 [Candidatus Moraniibacteriota bacterium]